MASKKTFVNEKYRYFFQALLTLSIVLLLPVSKGNNKITELRTILPTESQNS